MSGEVMATKKTADRVRHVGPTLPPRARVGAKGLYDDLIRDAVALDAKAARKGDWYELGAYKNVRQAQIIVREYVSGKRQVPADLGVDDLEFESRTVQDEVNDDGHAILSRLYVRVVPPGR